MNFKEKLELREKNRTYFKKIYGSEFVLEENENEKLYNKNKEYINKFKKC